MKKIRIYGLITGAIMCGLFLTAGCAKNNAIALKFAPEDSTTYKVTTEADKSVEWEGPAESKPKGFTGGHTGNRIEMTFTQDIKSIDDKGNAAAKITIKGLKYLAKVKDNIVLDFDSSTGKDTSSPFSKLIGQSYTIELTSSGQVSKVIDASDAQAAVSGGSSASKAAATLLSGDAIKELHMIPALPTADKDKFHIGDSWSSIEDFSFDLMGAKSYEKIYTLEKIEDPFLASFMRILRKDPKDHRIAVARMNAVPSAEKAKELYKEQAASFFSQMSDNIETYTGELKLDLTDGKIVEYHEKLQIEWIVLDPNPKGDKQPDAIRMTAVRLYSIEKID